jgi:SOS-response transcriptional repressor LexA
MQLSPHQQRLFDYIRCAIDCTGQAPRISDMAHELGCAESSARALLLRLEKRGAIRRIPNAWRAIEIVDRTAAREKENPKT